LKGNIEENVSAITLQFLINFQYLYLVVPVSYNCFNKEVGNDVINSEGGRMTNKHTFLLSNSSRKSRILVGGSPLLMDKKNYRRQSYLSKLGCCPLLVCFNQMIVTLFVT